MEAVYGEAAVAVNEEGFLLDPAAWTPAIGVGIANDVGITMSPERWTVVNAARDEFVTEKASPGLRRLSKKTGLPIKTFYDLFPDGPAKKIARIAGIPKPKSCL
jgi:dissimilatory sulfite reductase related protein